MEEDAGEQFHGNEAISAVVDERFSGEEDDDYEDLYNDVNVGENFLQSMKKNEDVRPKNDMTESENGPLQITFKQNHPPPPHRVPETAVAGGDAGDRNFGKDAGGSNTGLPFVQVVDGYQRQNIGFMRDGGPVRPPVVGGLSVELDQLMVNNRSGELDVNNKVVNGGGVNQQNPGRHAPTGADVVGPAGVAGDLGNGELVRQGGGNVNRVALDLNKGYGNLGGGVGSFDGLSGPINGTSGGATILFVGDLHWWTTDADLESELCKYGLVKEVKFFSEKASGKSKGYCQVEFFDSAAATACKEGMNGHMFNGRPCVVAYASPFTVKRMGEAQVSRNQQVTQATAGQSRGPTADAPPRPGGINNLNVGNSQGAGDSNRGYGKGNWGRGSGQGMSNRGPVGPLRNRAGGMGGRGIMGDGMSGFGQGNGPPPLMHPQTMMGPGFDPFFGGPMGRMGGYGGFPGGPTPPFSGMMPPFPPVGAVGLNGVAPHVNPAFFGRGMPMNGMGMMRSAAVDGPNVGMWGDPSFGGWAGEEHGGRASESSYGEEAVSDHQYGEAGHDRGAWSNSMKEKGRGSEKDWHGSSDRRHRDDRESVSCREMGKEKSMGHDNESLERRHRDDKAVGRDRERDREYSRDHVRERPFERDHQRNDRHRYVEQQRHREREIEYDEDRGRSSRTQSKSRLSHEEEQKSRLKEVEYGKRRRTSD